MYSTAIMLKFIDVTCLVLLFWAVPFTLAKMAARRFAGSTVRPVNALLKEIPGTVNGLVLGALAVYLLGVSFEDFAVNKTRAVSDKMMEIAGLDEVSRCKSRLIETFMLNDLTFSEDAIDARNIPIDASELEMIQNRGKAIYIAGEARGMTDEEVMDLALTRHCEAKLSPSSSIDWSQFTLPEFLQ